MFGERLNSARKEKGYTAKKMSDEINVSIRTYRNYESEHSYPSFQLLVEIADILDVSIDWLLGRDEFLAKHADEY